MLGSSLVDFALIWRLTEQTGSATILATASLASLLPLVILGPVVGALVDRWNRRIILIVADSSIAALTAFLAILYWTDVARIWHVYFILFLRGFGTAFHNPAMASSVSLMVPKRQLSRVAGFDQMRQSGTAITGPLLGALLVATMPIQAILAIDVATALVAVGPLFFIAIPQPTIDHKQDEKIKLWRSVAMDTAAGMKYLWKWKGLFIVLVSVSLIHLVNAPAWTLIPLLVKSHFGGGPAEWGLLTVARNVGSLIGGVLMSTWGGFKRHFVTMTCGLVMLGCVNLVRGVTPSNAFWLFLVMAFVSGPPASMFFASLKAAIQTHVPPELQGRVFATQSSLRGAMRPIGLAVFGPVAGIIGIRTLFLLSGIFFLAMAVFWILSPNVRHFEANQF